MIYSDGKEARLGDVVAIDRQHRGTVVACIDRDEYSDEHPKEQWSYLGAGIMVKTDFAGLVHYTASSSDALRLLERADDL